MPDVLPILVTGGEGQVGRELQALAWPDGLTVHAPGREVLDITSADSVRAAFAAQPYACVINCAAYTAVDRAETEVGAAFLVNAVGPGLLADACRTSGAPMIQISTDYVFDGAFSSAYTETTPTAPLNVYGASKLAGEWATRLGNPRSVVLRTAWVISPHRQNFLKTMLRLAQTRDRLGVVADQTGCPTSACDIAATLRTIAIDLMARTDAPTGVFHFVNEGSTSWAGLAREIFADSARRGARAPIVDEIKTADYPTPARRPMNSELSTAALRQAFGIKPRPWRIAVREILDELASSEEKA